MTRSLVVFSRWSLTPGTLLLETIRASDRGRPRRVVAQTRGRPRQVLLYCFFFLGLQLFIRAYNFFDVVGPDVQQHFWLSSWHCSKRKLLSCDRSVNITKPRCPTETLSYFTHARTNVVISLEPLFFRGRGIHDNSKLFFLLLHLYYNGDIGGRLALQ